MKNIILIIICFFTFVSSSFSCENAEQLKLFPIGIYNNTVISVDIEITRRFAYEIGKRYNVTIHDSISTNSAVSLKNRLSVYDLNQNLISSEIIDSTYFIGRDYTKELRKNHDKVVKLILKKYPTIELFEVKYLSFCDFQEKCNYIKTNYNDSTKTKKVIHEGKSYDLEGLKDKNNYFLSDNYLENYIPSLPISSIRIYETQKVKLITVHLGTQSNLPVFANMPKKEYQDEKIDYSSIKTFVYQEPLNHHGYGLDVFFSIVK
ncbi:hypothetical protein WAF17_10630 [Bernardetia sp. ABR2-2B]|uniref:hypothetical protein n=1 Tax=Bernardetia sp. ABR2-2B TaxID=3127472 RepID=UPI0030D45366